jgi:cytochrome c-type biogenesis protein CcmH/NrfF
MRRLTHAIVVCAFVLAAAPADADEAGARAHSLARSLMSPFCPGLLLADCQSSRAQELRAEIRGRFGRGETRDQIENDLVARFGPHVRAVPTSAGVGLLAWVLPALLAPATFLVLAWRLRQAMQHDPTPEPLRPAEDPAVAARLDQELLALE